jgi:hypothetical protein
VFACAALQCAACDTHVLVSEAHSEPILVHDAGVKKADAAPVTPEDASTTDGGILCGHTVCHAVELGESFGTGAPCCYDEGVCGARLPGTCAEVHAVGHVDATCPSFGSYSGCCRPDDTCGIEAVGTAFGCVNPIVLVPTVTLGACRYADD